MALPKKHSCSPERALEMRMRDSLDALAELACAAAHASTGTSEEFEILSIEPATDPAPPRSRRASVHTLPQKEPPAREADFADWLIRREQRL